MKNLSIENDTINKTTPTNIEDSVLRAIKKSKSHCNIFDINRKTYLFP